MMTLQNKKILLGLTGGVAIYKAAGLLRRLVQDHGAEVHVVMTHAAQQFMTPLIFETFSGRPVLTDMWRGGPVATRHISLAEQSDLILICPATANCIAKVAHGIADDLLTTIILAAGSKTLFALAMNERMLINPITQANIEQLRRLSYGLIEPATGMLACQTVGRGRLADEQTIIDAIDRYLNGRRLLQDKRVVVTAGATREWIDAVRFISNRSTGKMGYALARVAAREGARVTLISGPVHLSPPAGVELISVETAAQMQNALLSQASGCELLFMAAAVEDLVPCTVSPAKIRKSDALTTIPVTPAPDLTRLFREANPHALMVGFSVEYTEGKKRSRQKMQAKGLDYIAWNNPAQPGVGFAGDTNAATLLARDGSEWDFPLRSKYRLAENLIETISGRTMP